MFFHGNRTFLCNYYLIGECAILISWCGGPLHGPLHFAVGVLVCRKALNATNIFGTTYVYVTRARAIDVQRCYQRGSHNHIVI